MITAVLVCTLLFRLLWLGFCWQTQGIEWSLESDTGSYFRPAVNMLEGNGFSFQVEEDVFFPEVIRTPGYSVLLMPIIGLFNANWITATVIVQIMLDVLLAVLIFIICNYLTNRLTAVAAVVYYSLAPNVSLIAMSVLSESLYSIVNAAALILFIYSYNATRSRKFHIVMGILTGGLFGYAALVRPVGLHVIAGLCAVLVLFLIITLIKKKKNNNGNGIAVVRKKLLFTIVTMMVFLSISGSWIIRNGLKADYWSISAIDYINLLFYRAAGTEAQKRGVPFEEVSWEYRLERYDAENHRDQTPEGLVKGKFFKHEAKKIILNDLASYSKVALKGALKIMFGSHRSDFEDLFGERIGNFATYSVYLMLLIVWPVAAFGFIKEPRLLPLAIYMFVLIGISAGPESYSRFRAPLEPLLAIGFGVGLNSLYRIGIHKNLNLKS